MEAVILAGGAGTRLRPVVPDLPKPLAPVAGRPFLAILLEFLSRWGFRRIILSIGYMADAVVSCFGDRFEGMEIIYTVEQTPLGTGGAARLAMTRCVDDHVFVLNGDTFLDLEVGDVEAHWREHKAPIIVTCRVKDTARYGRLVADKGRITTFQGKGVAGPGLINAGTYVFPKDILEGCAADDPFSLEKDFLAEAVQKRRFDCFTSRKNFIDIGVPEDYARAQTDLPRFLRRNRGD